MQKILRLITVLTAFLASPGLFALGLGNASVDSYLGQPLDVRVQLISNSQEELNSVTAGLASASTLEALGIRRTVSIPLRFEVNTGLDNAYIQITSRLPASDPVIQVVVEARWAGGRIVREYTLFLDPPTFPSHAPAPVIINRASADAPAQQVPEIYPLPDKANIVQQSQPSPVVEAVTPPGQNAPVQRASETPGAGQMESTVAVADIEPALREPRQTATVPADPVLDKAEPEAVAPETEPVDAAEPSLVPETPAEPLAEATNADKANVANTEDPESVAAAPSPETADSARTPPVADEPEPFESIGSELSGDSIGPVQKGQTLWGIATSYARSTPYSVNQAMLAIQRLNPDAFGNNNINLLKRGAILRMPSGGEMGRISGRQAMVESMRQEAAYKADKTGLPFDSEAPAFANISDEPEVSGEDDVASQAGYLAQQEVSESAGESLLQLIPPSQDTDPGDSGNGSAIQPTGAVASEDLQEVLARTEEELVNAKQENAYLNERIRELEARVKESGGELAVTDGELAELESRLKEERLADEPVPEPVASKLASDEEWYSGKTWWLAGLFLLLIAAVVWLLKRLGGGGEGKPAPGERAAVKAIRSDAEDLLKSLDTPDSESESDPQTGNAAVKGNVINLESYGESGEKLKPSAAEHEAEPESKSGPKPRAVPDSKPWSEHESKPKSLHPGPKASPVENEDAVELDGDDPETMLDMARAYISMSDADSARRILEEVIEVGDESQVAEARGMMQEL